MNPHALSGAVWTALAVGACGARLKAASLRRRETHLERSNAGDGGPRTRVIRFVERRRAASRGRAAFDDDVARWLDGVARRIRAGSSLPAATTDAVAVAPPSVAEPLQPLVDGLRRSLGLVDAVGQVGTEPESPLAVAITVIGACARLGGPAAAPIERAADTLRMRQAVRAEQATQSAQAMMSARVMTLLPLCVLGVLALIEPGVRGAIASPAGATCLTAGGVLNVVGWRWMGRIVARVS